MKTAQQLFDQAFLEIRTARSPEYKAGVLAHLKYRMLETDECDCPYDAGTAAADAWQAGSRLSWNILELNNDDTDKRRQQEKQARLNKKAK